MQSLSSKSRQRYLKSLELRVLDESIHGVEFVQFQITDRILHAANYIGPLRVLQFLDNLQAVLESSLFDVNPANVGELLSGLLQQIVNADRVGSECVLKQENKNDSYTYTYKRAVI